MIAMMMVMLMMVMIAMMMVMFLNEYEKVILMMIVMMMMMITFERDASNIMFNLFYKPKHLPPWPRSRKICTCNLQTSLGTVLPTLEAQFVHGECLPQTKLPSLRVSLSQHALSRRLKSMKYKIKQYLEISWYHDGPWLLLMI